MKYIYLAIFIIVTGIHLYGSYIKNQGIRNATKGAILLAILGFYLESVQVPSWYLITAILTSWIGDMFLMAKGVKWFTIGGISFMISHIFFILSYIEAGALTRVPIWAMIPLALIFIAAVVVLFKKLRPFLPKALFYPMFLYLLINGANNCFALFRVISLGTLGAVIGAIGAMGYFISDSTLFFVRFNKDSRIKSHFLIMLTYSLGVFLIVLGFVL